MTPSAHRWLDRLVLLPLVAVVASVAAVFGASTGDHERITQAWYLAELPAAADAGGGVPIAEQITYDFGVYDRHGIYRDVPDLLANPAPMVSSPTAPTNLSVYQAPGPDENVTRIQIGDPNRTVTQVHTYAISYHVARSALTRERDFAWDAHGVAWTVPAEHVEAHVVAPNEWDKIRCVAGSEGSDEPCDIEQVEPGHLVATADELRANEGLTIFATVGAPLSASPEAPAPPSSPDPEGFGVIMSVLVAGVAAAAATVPVSIWSRRRGRDQVARGGPADAAFADDSGAGFRLMDDTDLARMATIEFEAPRSLSAVQGSIVITESVGNGVFTSWLLEAAGRGEVDIEIEPGNEKSAMLRRTDGSGGSDDPDADSVLAGIFSGREEVRLGKFDQRLDTARKRVVRTAKTWMKDSDLWDARATARNIAVVARGVLGGLVALAVIFWGAWMNAEHVHPAWLVVMAVAAVLAGAFLTSVVRAWELRVRTPAGSAAWLQVESFRRFLHQSEARHVEAAAKAGLLRQYTAWAVALGETNAWTKAVDAASAADPALRSSVGGDLMFAARAASLTAIVATSSAPKSSGGSGGGGFGGGVGGGGGGGGGGSW